MKFRDKTYGDGFIGYSRVNASQILPLADGLEVIHSENGAQFKNNYFGRFDPHATGPKPPDDSGHVDTVEAQYGISLSPLLNGPGGGAGPDISLTVFGMCNQVASINQNTNVTTNYKKLKAGAEVIYTALPWLALGGRFDNVQPDTSDHAQAFNVATGKTIFRTSFVTREWVVLQYSRYILGNTAYPSFPFNALPKGDANAVMLQASMGW